MRPVALVLLGFALAGCSSVQGGLFDLAAAQERSRSGLQTHTAEVGDTRVPYLERRGTSAAAPTLVLLHGFGGFKDHWLRLVRVLPARHRVVALDLPGHGDAPFDPATTHDIGFFAEHVAAAVEQLSDGPVVLVGNSLGGWIAAEVALAHPEAVRALVLLDPAGVPAPDTSALDRLLLAGEHPLIPTSRAEYDRLTALAFGDDPPALPWPADAVLARRAAARAPVLRAIWRDLGPSTLPERLPGLRVPTLLLWGAEDAILDPSAAPRWAALVPDIEVELLGGVGHAPMLEQPETTAARVVRFLSSVD